MINKLRSMVRFKQNPKPLTYKRLSQISFLRRMWRKYDSDSKNYLVSPTSESNKPPSGTGSSFEILRNEKILITTRWGLG